jgi:hypothetical protein
MEPHQVMLRNPAMFSQIDAAVPRQALHEGDAPPALAATRAAKPRETRSCFSRLLRIRQSAAGERYPDRHGPRP